MLITAATVQAAPAEWTWMSGDNMTNQAGIYGNKGTANSANVPGARDSSISWTDSSGNLWLFGGFFNYNSFNDLWRYDPDTSLWTWMRGSNMTDQRGVYGIKGTPAVANRPGARYNSISWTDSSGDFWLFGGGGYDSNGDLGLLNDLWRYNPDTNLWTWMSGDNETDQFGVYGTKGTASPNNVPGARWDSASWTDNSGNLWLFGGRNSASFTKNDLWRYDPDTSLWTWMSGSNMSDQRGVYGTKGIPAAANRPGARYDSISWTDSTGDLWLFGAVGKDRLGDLGGLNDLWRYNPDTNLWAWMSGDTLVNQTSIYGTKGIPDGINKPGARDGSFSWTDNTGNFWLFGGYDFELKVLNDLWRYDIDTDEWTWMSGDNETKQKGIYGTKGTPAAANKPGERYNSISWTDSTGDLWLFGGLGLASRGRGNLNDLWRYEVPECYGDTCPDGFCVDYACVECEFYDDCLGGGACVNNVCVECASDSDCDNGFFCDGEELCDNSTGVCVSGAIPCIGDFCDETDNSCLECLDDSDCDNDEYCDGTETCDAGMCFSGTLPCPGDFCDETDKTCLTCLGDDDCFGGRCIGNVCFDCRVDVDCDNGVCTGNICVECAIDSDCDNGLYCDGKETCDAGVCVEGSVPCAGDFCDEELDSCQMCLDDSDCFNGFCVENACVECTLSDDCDNGMYCDGAESCTTGVCESGTDPCDGSTPVCEERYDECVECLADYDCDDIYKCESTMCVPRCELTIKYKALSTEKLSKKRKKLSLSITGDEGFDPTGEVDAGGLQVLKPKPNTKKGRLKLKLLIPQGAESEIIPIRVGDCFGEIEIQ